MQGNGGILKGVIEADETFVGGLSKNMHKGKRKVRGTGGMGKTPVIGVLERGGNVQAKVATDITSQTLLPNIVENVEKGATVCTDEWCSYNPLTKNTPLQKDCSIVAEAPSGAFKVKMRFRISK